MSNFRSKIGMGWLRDYPDFRDFTYQGNKVPDKLKRMGEKSSIKGMLKKVGVVGPSSNQQVPSNVDLREYCPPVEDQGRIGSCTANAGVALLEYFEKRAFGRHIDASRLFLYKVTRKLMHTEGDTGAFLRTTMGAMTLFGVPPDEYWPYDTDLYDEEPPAFCYAFAQNYQALQYFRLDPPGTKSSDLLNRIKNHLAGNLPVMFGFSVFSSIWDAGREGEIPFPKPFEKQEGGHAVVAVGYDDKVQIENKGLISNKTNGAFLIRNSWGTSWGDRGYGWLPYDFVLQNLAVDWWSLLKNEWVDTGEFQSVG